MTVQLRNNVRIHGPAGGTGDGLTAPTVGEDGYVAIADGGDLTYLPGTNDGDVLTWNDGTQTWEAAAGGGDVLGPVSASDNQVVRFDTDGAHIQAGTNAPTYDDSGNLSINAGTALRFWNAAGTFYVGLSAPTLAASHTLRLPPTDGTAGQALVTDGDGNLSFVTIAGEGGGVTDHGALTGLTDVSDHPGYLLTSGTRTASYIQFGTYPATVGYVRLPTGGAIFSRNYANGDDLQLMRLTGSGNSLELGESGVPYVSVTGSSYAGLFTSAGTLRLSTTNILIGMNALASSLTASGYQSLFRYHNTLCVATEGGRSSLAPMVVV